MKSCHTYGWVMSHIWINHTYGWVMSHMWISHVTHMNESCHATWRSPDTHINQNDIWMICVWYDWFIYGLPYMNPLLWIICDTHMNGLALSIPIHIKSVMSHIWMGHVTHVNESCHTHEWVMSCSQYHTYSHDARHIIYIRTMSRTAATRESCHTYEQAV